jgi:hypothetical protein
VSGYHALIHNTTGTGNTVDGYQAGFGGDSDTAISGNTIAGYQAGYNVAGNNNIFLGWQAGFAVTTGHGNIIIGYNQQGVAATSNALNIGGILHGNLATGNIGISTNTPEARLDVKAGGLNPTDMAQIWRESGGVIKASMSATGVMMATKFIGDGSGLTNAGDNLGNHVATTTLNMNTKEIVGVSTITIAGNGGRLLGISNTDSTANDAYGAMIGLQNANTNSSTNINKWALYTLYSKTGASLQSGNENGGIYSMNSVLNGTLASLFGFQSRLQVSGGSVTNAYNYYASPDYGSNAGAIGTRAGLWIDDIGRTNVTTQFGIYLNNMTSATNNYGIYSVGGRNYFGGDMQIGGTLSLSHSGWVEHSISGQNVTDSVGLGMGRTPGGGSFDLEFAVAGQAGYWADTAVQGDAVIRSSTNLLFVTGRPTISEKMRINTAGNVGIGTIAPAYKLTVSSGIISNDGTGAGIVTSGPLAASSGTFTGSLFVSGISSFTAAVHMNNDQEIYLSTPSRIHVTGGVANQVLTNDGNNRLKWAMPGGGDNLGNHVATATLNMGNFGIVNAASMTVTNGITASSGTFTAAGANQYSITASSGISAPLVRLAANMTVSSMAPAMYGGGVMVSTNVYIVGFASATYLYGNGSHLTGMSEFGDSLGSHIATTTLNMANFGIINIASASINHGLTVIGTTTLNGGLFVPAGSTFTGTMYVTGVSSFTNALYVNGVSSFTNTVYMQGANDIYLSAPQQIHVPGGGVNQVLANDGSNKLVWSTVVGLGGGADHLGNHIATMTLNMNGRSIVNAASGTFTNSIASSAGAIRTLQAILNNSESVASNTEQFPLMAYYNKTGGGAQASYDNGGIYSLSAVSAGSLEYLKGVASRLEVSGSGSVSTAYNFYASSGSSVSGTSHIGARSGLYVADIRQHADYQYGVFIEPLESAVLSYGIYSSSGINYFGGVSTFTGTVSMNNDQNIYLSTPSKVHVTGGVINQVLANDGSNNLKWASVSSLGAGDNLGNHVATTTLNMKGYNAVNVGSVTFNSASNNVFVSSATAAQQGGVYVSTNVYAAGSLTLAPPSPALPFQIVPGANYTSIIIGAIEIARIKQ